MSESPTPAWHWRATDYMQTHSATGCVAMFRHKRATTNNERPTTNQRYYPLEQRTTNNEHPATNNERQLRRHAPRSQRTTNNEQRTTNSTQVCSVESTASLCVKERTTNNQPATAHSLTQLVSQAVSHSLTHFLSCSSVISHMTWLAGEFRPHMRAKEWPNHGSKRTC